MLISALSSKISVLPCSHSPLLSLSLSVLILVLYLQHLAATLGGIAIVAIYVAVGCSSEVAAGARQVTLRRPTDVAGADGV